MKQRLIATIFFLIYSLSYIAYSQSYRVGVYSRDHDKCGYMDLNGELKLEGVYDYYYPYTEDGTALVCNKSWKDIHLFDIEGNEIIPEIKKIKIIIDNAVPPVTPHLYSGGILRVKIDGKIGGLNTKGKFSVPAIYDDLTDFNDGYAVGKRDKVYYVVFKDGSETLIENNETIIYIKHFTEGLAPIEVKGQMWGFINTSGNFVIHPRYKGVGYFNGKYAWVRTENNTIGFINNKDEWVITPKYSVVHNFDKESGIAMVKKDYDGEWKYIDTTGKIQNYNLKRNRYDFSNGLAIAKSNGKVGYINNKGEWELMPIFQKAHKFINDHAVVKMDGGWGLINKNGRWVIPPEYNFVGNVAVIK